MIIRDETPFDIDVITEITAAAFADCPHGNHTEQFIIHALRAAGVLSVSLAAEIDGRVVGHIAFSPVMIGGKFCDWYGMGPVSVKPELQRRGIGKALIEAVLKRLKKSGAKGCVLVGDPGYYERFGFRNLTELILEGVPTENFLALPFGGEPARGVVVFHDGFGATE